MIIENTLDKSKLISELKEIHIELLEIYKNIFDYKYHTNKDFKDYIDKEYKENGISIKDQQAWNDNFCHRASYTLLNKILFIRICEDKGFMLNPEDYVAGEPKDSHIGEKLSRKGLQKWANLVTNYTLGGLVKLAFLDMKKSYSNIVLYKVDKYEIINPTTEELSLKYLDGDEKAQKFVLQFENILNSIVEEVDTNNFNFKNTDGNILGDVYEKFMDRETRKAIGQFYTPEFVIEYILKNTVAETDVVENPFVSVADISCGSGHFLIMAYDILREKFINNLELLRDKYADEVYTIKKNGIEEELTGKDYWKAENIHYHLLKHCIYGADIDSFAVQLTTINLLLKDLDNFTDELNIVECDSLIKWEEDYDWQDLKQQLEEEFETVEYSQINLLGEEEKVIVTEKKEIYELTYIDLKGINRIEDVNKERAEEIVYLCKFWTKKFDYIVGNPPYVGHKQLNIDHEKWLINNYSNVFKDKSDLSFCFFERILSVLSERGTSGIITSRYFMESPTGTNLRLYLQYNASIENIVDFYGAEIFKGAGVATAIYIFGNSNNDYNNIKISKLTNDEYEFTDNCDLFNLIRTDIFENFNVCSQNLEKDRWMLIPEQYLNIYKKIIKKTGYKLDNIVTSFQGIITGCDKAFVMTYKEAKEKEVEEDLLKKWIKNSDVNSYIVKNNELVLIYSDLIDTKSEYPKSMKQISKYRDKLENRRECKNGARKWYHLQWGRESSLFEQPKIVFPYKAKSNRFAIDCDNCYCSADVYSMILKDDFKDVLSLEYLVGLLNSNIYEFYFKLFAKKMGKGIYDYYPNSVLDLRIITDEIIEKFEINTKKIIKLYFNIDNIDIDEILNSECVLKYYIAKKVDIAKIKEKIFLLREENDDIIAEYLGLDENEIKLINGALNYIGVNSVKMAYDKEKFYKDYVIEDKSIDKIALENGISRDLIEVIWGNYIEEFLYKGMDYRRIDLLDLINIISNYLQGGLVDILNSIGKPVDIVELKSFIQERFPKIIKVIKSLKLNNVKISLHSLVKESLNKDSYTWNGYRKAKKKDKINKTFVKYYDTNFYGLSEWSDEIHKGYFLYAIKEYTSNKLNKKKSKELYILFKGLNIKDKQYYIEVIGDKIKSILS